MTGADPSRLKTVAPDLEHLLMSAQSRPPPFDTSNIIRRREWVTMRDGIRLATDLYLPPKTPAPVIAVRTPYGRSAMSPALETFARHGYAVIAQDCRGTGDSEPDHWDTYIYEREDSFDCVEWIVGQSWCDGFVAACGGSYLGSTQWAMAMHPRMSTIAPEVAGLVIYPTDMPRYHMLVNAYSRSVGRGADKVPVSYQELERRMLAETLASGYFNEPIVAPLSNRLLERCPQLRTLSSTERRQELWSIYVDEPPATRAELIKLALDEEAVTLESFDQFTSVLGHKIPVGLYINPFPTVAHLARSLQCPALVITGWYDWGLGDTLASWDLITREASQVVRTHSRLLITPSAHNRTGYHEDATNHPELRRIFRTLSVSDKSLNVANMGDVLLRWYSTVREGTIEDWPRVIYYLMGAGEWRTAASWPPPQVTLIPLYLGPGGTLNSAPPLQLSDPDEYRYDPEDPTPTVGGSIISSVYPPGSVDVREVQQRPDVLTYTTAVLERDVEVVGPLRVILYASSSARDTDFAARLTDVFPDGRAIQLQIGVLRARYRDPSGAAQPLTPGQVYRFELDLWATANRFRAGHRLRVDICSADFPRLDRNTNRGGEPGAPVPATQSIYRDERYPSHILLPITGRNSEDGL
jgi:predicted acyl esterase